MAYTTDEDDPGQEDMTNQPSDAFSRNVNPETVRTLSETVSKLTQTLTIQQMTGASETQRHLVEVKKAVGEVADALLKVAEFLDIMHTRQEERWERVERLLVSGKLEPDDSRSSKT